MRVRRAFVPVQIGVRLTPRLKTWLDQRAEVEEMAVSTLVRTWIEREAKRDLQGSREVSDGGLRVASDD